MSQDERPAAWAGIAAATAVGEEMNAWERLRHEYCDWGLKGRGEEYSISNKEGRR